MDRQSPRAAIEGLVAARARREVQAALAFYEPGARVVVAPGQVETGVDAVRAFTAAAIDLPISFGDRTIIESGDVALHIGAWTISPPDGAPVRGRTADVLRRQSDGSWLVAIDNAWGVALLDHPSQPRPAQPGL